MVLNLLQATSVEELYTRELHESSNTNISGNPTQTVSE